MLNIAGQQMTNLTAYNEYITDVIISVIVYLSAFSLVIKMWIARRQKKDDQGDANAEPAPPDPVPVIAADSEETGKEAQEKCHF